ncbi:MULTISPECIES: Uma2 family endonuclease [unclassified Microcoleus]|uniref:Uma2 family endonuclease n=1 Tax=unclassified Microcoleus TaxID=2642155 RepID=UPI002FD280FF
MSVTEKPELLVTDFTDFPDHTQLPDSDGTFVKNFQELPQSILLTTSVRPILDQLHPDGQYCIGQDSGIYWRVPQPPEPLARGAEAPDWFYVPDVPPTLDGNMRRSYVMWKELMPPLIILEFVSGDGSEERDKTPKKGQFWIYERIIRPAFYGIYEVTKAKIECYHLVEDRFELMSENQRGHYQIEPMGLELGIWQGVYQGVELPWMRWWDAEGNLLLAADERVEQAELAVEQAQSEAEQERQKRIEAEQRIQALEARLRELEGG